ncbi:pyruvate dehydrogenase complex E1 alpha subunit [Actinidia rufa]|uniref:Pyruvate dehydrogenase complex E1 alpha subunit n=1 Tax=Actinidia rufa TaxID=165716 RepID=A0A7J0GPQ7_9ERIC|nr:pyruvate dehydrogenase complex E1 alpha subunit [Actinidia rufa]
MRKSEADTSQIILPFNFSRSTLNLTSSSNTCTLTTVSTAAGAVSGKRLSDVHPLFISAEESVILPAILDFLARIWAQHHSRVVQASLCPVSSSGFLPNSAYQPSCGVIVDVTVRINKGYPRAWVGCIPVLIPSSDSLCNIVYCHPPSSLELGRGSPRLCELDVRASYAHLYTFFFYRAGRSLRTGGSSASLTQREKEIIALRPLHHFLAAVVLLSRVGGASPSDSDMALNRAQMLVRDSEALAQFRVDHRIPNDVVIERPGPNDDADWVEGEGNRMPIRTWFIYQAGLRFPLSKLLRSVLSICGLTFILGKTLRPRCSKAITTFALGSQISLRRGFNRHFWRRSDRCSAAISAIVRTPSGYIPLYRYTIPLRAARQGHPVLPPLQIHGPGSRPRSSLSDEVSDLFEGTSTELRRLIEEAKGESSGSSESSSSSWDIDLGDEALNEEAEVEDGEEVDQIPTAAPLVPAPLVLVPEPINLPSSDSDVAIVEPREIVEHSYSHGDSSSVGSQLNAEIMAPKVRILGRSKPQQLSPPHSPRLPGPSQFGASLPSIGSLVFPTTFLRTRLPTSNSLH